MDKENLKSKQPMANTTEIPWDVFKVAPHNNLSVVWITHSHFLPLFMGAVN